MMYEETKTVLKSPWVYLLAAFAWTWLFWGVGIWLGASMETPAGGMLMLAGVAGPTITGIVFTNLTRDREGRRDYWKRVRSFKAIPAKWFLIIFLFVPALNLLAALIDVLLGGSGATWGATAGNLLSDPFSLLTSFLFATLIPFLEELGWRGYLLDRLQEKKTALESSLILGVVWSVWHLPLFFIADSYQAGLGIGTLEFWLFMFGLVPLNFAFTWIYNNTGRSTLAVILFHAMVNFSGELIALNKRSDTISIALWFVAAIGITIFSGAKTFTSQKKALPV